MEAISRGATGRIARPKVNRALGRWGEDQAAKHMSALGWIVLDRNWRCPAGELDLVGRQPDDTIVFVEVKTRSGLGYGDPLEAITHAKVRKLHDLALLWLRERNLGVRKIRLDAIGLVRGRDGVDLTHVKGISQ